MPKVHAESRMPVRASSSQRLDPEKAAKREALAKQKASVNKVLGQGKTHSSFYKFVNAGQVLLSIPAVCMLAAAILSRFVHVSPGGLGGQALRDAVLIGAIDNYIRSIILAIPFVVTVMHYTAALHAKSIGDHVHKRLNKYNSSKPSPEEKAAASPVKGHKADAADVLTVGQNHKGDSPVERDKADTADVLNVAKNHKGEPIWPPACTEWACQRAAIPMASALQLIAVTATGFLIYPVGMFSGIVAVLCLTLAASLRMMCIGLLRREREGASRYVHLVYQPRVYGLGLVQVFITAYGMLVAFSTPAIIWVDEWYARPLEASLECLQLAQNVTYKSEFCGMSPTKESYLYDWRQMAAFQSSSTYCSDGGSGPYRSRYDACIALIASYELPDRRMYAAFSAQAYLTLLLIISEHVTNTDPDLTMSNFLGRKVRAWVKLAICSAYVGSVGIAAGIAQMLLPGTQEVLYLLNYHISLVCSACFFVSLVLLCINFATQRHTYNYKAKHYFISYKQNDGNDGAVQMLYWQLQQSSHVWLDKYAEKRSVCAMRDGVEHSHVFIAVLSPKYFESEFCCLELHTAIEKNIPIVWTWNNTNQTIQAALKWIPQSLIELNITDTDFLPVQEDVQMARPCAEQIRIKSAEYKPLHLKAPIITIGKYTAPLELQIFQYFISYKENDGNDGAVQLLYSQLQPLPVRLDTYANSQDEATVRAGVLTAEKFIAVLSPGYFDSSSCRMKLSTAIEFKKPIILTWNQSKHTLHDAIHWIPKDVMDLGISIADLLPIEEDVQQAGPCAEGIRYAVRKPFTGEAAVNIATTFLDKNIYKYFISYMANDGNDGAVHMLYSQLQPSPVWLDTYVNSQDESAMRAGVRTAEKFIAVLSPGYFYRRSCCMELHTAMKFKKPIFVTWNQSKHTSRDAKHWIPKHVMDLGISIADLLPVDEDVQQARPCAERIQSAVREPFTGKTPVNIGAYSVPTDEEPMFLADLEEE